MFDKNIPELIEDLEELRKSDLNRRKEKICKEYVENKEIIPFYVLAEENFWCTKFNYDMVSYYKDPLLFLKAQLMIELYSFNNFTDFAVLSEDIRMYLGTGLPFVILGMKPLFFSNLPFYVDVNNPLIKTEADLDKLEMPDFHKSSIMLHVLFLYGMLNKLSKNRLNILFPTWIAGPWSMAWHIRGVTNLLLDIHRNPKLIRKIMDFVTEARINWENERIKKFGDLGSSAFSTPYLPEGNECILGNDEVDGTMFSPKFYETHIFPYEKMLAQRSDRTYYHSCGNITNLLPIINKLPRLYKVEICRTGNTDLETAVRVLDENVILQLCMHPIHDVFESTPKEMEKTLEKIIRESRGRRIEIVLEGINCYPRLSVDAQVEKIKQWIDIAYEVTKQRSIFH